MLKLKNLQENDLIAHQRQKQLQSISYHLRAFLMLSSGKIIELSGLICPDSPMGGHFSYITGLGGYRGHFFSWEYLERNITCADELSTTVSAQTSNNSDVPNLDNHHWLKEKANLGVATNNHSAIMSSGYGMHGGMFYYSMGESLNIDKLHF